MKVSKWRSTKLEVHREIYVEHRENMNAMIKQTKMDYYESESATGKQDACVRVIKELKQVPRRMLPEASGTKKNCVMTSQCSELRIFFIKLEGRLRSS